MMGGRRRPPPTEVAAYPFATDQGPPPGGRVVFIDLAHQCPQVIAVGQGPLAIIAIGAVEIGGLDRHHPVIDAPSFGAQKIGRRAIAGGDHRHATGHRLKQGQTPTLGAEGADESVTGAIDGGHVMEGFEGRNKDQLIRMAWLNGPHDRAGVVVLVMGVVA